MPPVEDALAELIKDLRRLTRLPPRPRAQRARALIDRAKTVLSAVGDAAVAEAVEASSQAEVARELGVTPAAVFKAVNRHRSRGKQ